MAATTIYAFDLAWLTNSNVDNSIFINKGKRENFQGYFAENNEEQKSDIVSIWVYGSVVSWLLLQFVRQPATSLPYVQYGLFSYYFCAFLSGNILCEFIYLYPKPCNEILKQFTSLFKSIWSVLWICAFDIGYLDSISN